MFKLTNRKEEKMKIQVIDKTNETITWQDIDTWHCQKCNTYIDDKTEEMEMHECKQMEVN
jgi:hypothetical protein